MRVSVAALALALALALLAASVGVEATQEPLELRIGVVEASPRRALQLGAAVRAAGAAAREARAGAGAGADVQVLVDVAGVEPHEALAVPSHVCAQAGEGKVAVVSGGGGAAAVSLAAAAAARAGVPLLQAGPAPAALGASAELLALYPRASLLARAGLELVREKGWRRAVLLHTGSAAPAALLAPDDERLSLLARQLPPALEDEALRASGLPQRLEDDDLLPRQLPKVDDDAELRSRLMVLKKSEESNFIIWCSSECALLVLDAAQRVGLLDERHSYVVLALELHTMPLHDYSHGGANVTGLMLFDPDTVTPAMERWHAAYLEELPAAAAAEAAAERAVARRVVRAPPSELLLAYDATLAVVDALLALGLAPGEPAQCDRGAGAFHADTLLNYLRADSTVRSGVTALGALAWEADGSRRDVALRVAELARGGRLEGVGLWTEASGVAWSRPKRPVPPPQDGVMTGRHFNILIAMNSPYVMRRESSARLSGNDQYEGFCIELIERLAEMKHFNFTFKEQEDGKYGNYDNTSKKWNGMLGRLMEDSTVHFAITDLTITAEREKVVDFTTPFMNLGISILFHKPLPAAPRLFAFLLPFSNEVWMYLGLAYLGTSLLLYVVGRVCPEEWQNPYPCVEEPVALENQFTLGNALWFNLGAMLQQGSEIAPAAYGTRAVASVWWLFALVITSSYTANLATLLAKKSSNEVIKDVVDLANNTIGIKYGAKSGGSTFTFFQPQEGKAQNDLYKRMWEHMSQHPMPSSNNDGIDRVLKGDYAFLMESTTIEYTVERNCEVIQVGGLLDSKGYGIAMRKNSAYRQELNLALLNMQEAGELREMKHVWWKEKHGGGACKSEDDRQSEKLSMDNFLGLFVVLVVGCVLGVAVSCVDLAWEAARRPRDRALPFLHRFWAELRFIFRFDQSVKPVQGPLSAASSGATGSTRRSSRGDPDDADADAEEAEREAEAEGEGEGEDVEAAPAPAGGGGPRARRRSSMHAASLRLARHASAASPTR